MRIIKDKDEFDVVFFKCYAETELENEFLDAVCPKHWRNKDKIGLYHKIYKETHGVLL